MEVRVAAHPALAVIVEEDRKDLLPRQPLEILPAAERKNPLLQLPVAEEQLQQLLLRRLHQLGPRHRLLIQPSPPLLRRPPGLGQQLPVLDPQPAGEPEHVIGAFHGAGKPRQVREHRVHHLDLVFGIIQCAMVADGGIEHEFQVGDRRFRPLPVGRGAACADIRIRVLPLGEAEHPHPEVPLQEEVK